jgi:predicted nucleic acid-binding protein
MICLDTNYLILGLVAGSREAAALLQWHRANEVMVTSSICWYEFLCGPVTPAQIDVMRRFLRQTIPFEEAQAHAAARLFNAVGRKRALRVDSMVAATALVAGARLATHNLSDFADFTPLGLILV